MLPISSKQSFSPLNEYSQREVNRSRFLRIFACSIGFWVFFLGIYYISNNFPIEQVENKTSQTEDQIKEQQFKVLIEWMKKSGARMNGVEGKSMFAGGGRGLYATKEIRQYENAFTVPSNLWISDRNAKKRSAISYLIAKDDMVKKYIDKAGDSWGLILMLEYEQYNPFSFWKPYTDFIPKPASSIRWNDSDIIEVQSTLIKSKIESNKKYIRAAYDELMIYLIKKYPNMFSAENNTFESFLASSLTAWSRSFETVPSSEPVRERGLVPLGDLLNHKSGVPQVHWSLVYDKKDCDPKEPLAFEFYAPEDKQPGEEIVITYSDHRATTSWFLWGGFSPLDYFYGDYITLEITDNPELPEPKTNRLTWVGRDGQVSEEFLEYYIKCKYRNFRENDFAKSMWKSGLEDLAKNIEKFENTLPTTLFNDLNEIKNNDKEKIEFKRFQGLIFRSRFKFIMKEIQMNVRFRANLDNPKEKKWSSTKENSIVDGFSNSNDWTNSNKIGLSMISVVLDDPVEFFPSNMLKKTN